MREKKIEDDSVIIGKGKTDLLCLIKMQKMEKWRRKNIVVSKKKMRI